MRSALTVFLLVFVVGWTCAHLTSCFRQWQWPTSTASLTRSTNCNFDGLCGNYCCDEVIYE